MLIVFIYIVCKKTVLATNSVCSRSRLISVTQVLTTVTYQEHAMWLCNGRDQSGCITAVVRPCCLLCGLELPT